MPRPPQAFTPELMESGRYRYEKTDEYVHLIAQDFGISRSHFDRLVTRWGWTKRKDRPPRGLPPAQRILSEAQQAIVADAKAATAPQERAANAECVSTAAAASEAAALDRDAIAERLERAVEKELAAVELMRAQYGPLPQPPVDAERMARTLQTLTETLFKVQRLRSPETRLTGPDDFDDMPRDIDEFRHALARRIEAFVRSRTNGALPAAGDSAGADLPQQ